MSNSGSCARAIFFGMSGPSATWQFESTRRSLTSDLAFSPLQPHLKGSPQAFPIRACSHSLHSQR